jgi:hypothetical protein
LRDDLDRVLRLNDAREGELHPRMAKVMALAAHALLTRSA